MHLRKVPVHTEILGKDAQATEPDIKQIFIIGCNDQQELELKLYLIRKRVEKRVSATDLPAKDDFYIASLSTKNIVYKGMLESMQLRHYFPDLTQPYFTSGLAWYTHVSAPTPSPLGAWHNLSAYWHITGKSTRYEATGDGWRPGRAYSPPPESRISTIYARSSSRA